MNSITEAEGREAEAEAAAAVKKKKQLSQNLGSEATADDDDCYDNFVS